MKTKCTEETQYGEKVSISFFMPSQEAMDEGGMLPEISVDVLDLLVEAEANGCEETAGIFLVDARSLILEGAYDAEQAKSIAKWLELMAADVKSKFNLL